MGPAPTDFDGMSDATVRAILGLVVRAHCAPLTGVVAGVESTTWHTADWLKLVGGGQVSESDCAARGSESRNSKMVGSDATGSLTLR